MRSSSKKSGVLEQAGKYVIDSQSDFERREDYSHNHDDEAPNNHERSRGAILSRAPTADTIYDAVDYSEYGL